MREMTQARVRFAGKFFDNRLAVFSHVNAIAVNDARLRILRENLGDASQHAGFKQIIAVQP